jgi:hypothetical protein
VNRLWPWLAALIPAGLGLAAGVWLGSGQIDNPIVVVRGPLAAWLSRLGLLVSLLLLGGLANGGRRGALDGGWPRRKTWPPLTGGVFCSGWTMS